MLNDTLSTITKNHFVKIIVTNTYRMADHFIKFFSENLTNLTKHLNTPPSVILATNIPAPLHRPWGSWVTDIYENVHFVIICQ